MLEFKVNFVCVFITAAAYYIFGALWYSPLMFGKPWLALLGINQNDIKELKYPVAFSYTFSFVLSVLLASLLKFNAGVDNCTFCCYFFINIFLCVSFFLINKKCIVGK